MSASASAKHLIFLDTDCMLCSAEARFIRKHDLKSAVGFIDIAAPDFSPEKWGVDPEHVRLYMHMRTPEGKIVIGVPAFIRIWSLVPGLRGVARLLSLPVMFQLAQIGYFVFARVRPWLPKRKSGINCEF
ncbi:MAG: thiol-disulfide oxidoreductase DCC family protein [Bacteriovoracia bacterium]